MPCSFSLAVADHYEEVRSIFSFQIVVNNASYIQVAMLQTITGLNDTITCIIPITSRPSRTTRSTQLEDSPHSPSASPTLSQLMPNVTSSFQHQTYIHP